MTPILETIRKRVLTFVATSGGLLTESAKSFSRQATKEKWMDGVHEVPVLPPNGGPIIWVQVVAWTIDQAIRLALAQVSGGQTAGPIRRVD